RLVTRGTITEPDLLPPRASNYLAALAMLRHGDTDYALAWADISTGETAVMDLAAAALEDELARIDPAELLLTDATREALAEARIQLPAAAILQPVAPAAFDSEAGADRIHTAFAAAELDATAFTRAGRAALGALLGYVHESQKGAPLALRPPAAEQLAAHMAIDAATRASLELLQNQRGGTEGSLLRAIDLCVTAPGSRLLARRLAAPLCDPAAINARLEAVAALRDDTALTGRLRPALKSVPDVTRALTRLALHRGGPRDLVAIANAIGAARLLAQRLAVLPYAPAALSAVAAALDAAAEALATEL